MLVDLAMWLGALVFFDRLSPSIAYHSAATWIDAVRRRDLAAIRNRYDAAPVLRRTIAAISLVLFVARSFAAGAVRLGLEVGTFAFFVAFVALASRDVWRAFRATPQ